MTTARKFNLEEKNKNLTNVGFNLSVGEEGARKQGQAAARAGAASAATSPSQPCAWAASPRRTGPQREVPHRAGFKFNYWESSFIQALREPEYAEYRVWVFFFFSF